MTAEAPELHVLLVGIDHYLPNELDGGVFYGHLYGAVRDVEAVEAWLLHGLGVPRERIEKLTSSQPGLPEPPEPRELRPTYENLTAALRRLEEAASPGEQVLVHFSGHGGRTPTAVPEVKGPHGLDECLVPLDIGDSSSRYLRDVEIGAWLRRLRGKGVFATLVLDCCHAGGAFRKNERLRGTDRIDRTPRPAASLLATPEEMIEAWGWSPDPSQDPPPAAWNGRRELVLRNTQGAQSWEVDPTGFALFAACSPRQKALEAPLDGGEARGVLSWYLMSALGRLGAESTYQTLHEALRAHVATGHYGQMPMLFGETDRLLLGRRRLPAQWGVSVLDSSGEGGPGEEVVLNTGVAQGVGAGARFAIHPLGSQPADSASGSALVEITQAGAVTSRARVLRRTSDAALLPGDQAGLMSPGAGACRRRVRLRMRGAPVEGARALARLRQDLEASPWLVPVGWGTPADLQVTLGATGRFEIESGDGVALGHAGVPLRAGEPGSLRCLQARLEHLARFQVLRELRQDEPGSALAGKLEVRLERLPEGHRESCFAGAVPFDPAEGPYRVEAGEWVELRVCNRSMQELCVSVLDLQPDWGVTQAHPRRNGGDFETVDPGSPLRVSLQAYLPPDFELGTDVLKIIATTAPVSWRWLEMPALADLDGSRPIPVGSTGGEEPDLEAGRGAAVAAAATPAGNLAADPRQEWVTESVELTVVRGKAGAGAGGDYRDYQSGCS